MQNGVLALTTFATPAARVRHREPLAPVGDERLLLTAGATDRGARLVNHIDQLVREAAAVASLAAQPRKRRSP